MGGEWFDPLPWLILLPLLWGTAAFLLGPGRGAWLGIGGTLLQLLPALHLAAQVVETGERRYPVGGWEAPLGIELAVDGLSALMVLMSAAVALPVAWYARTWFRMKPAAGVWFWPLTGFLLAALNALFLSADLFNLYVTLELLGLAAVGLTAAGGGREAVGAALRYLLASLLGSGAYLLGVALIYGLYGTLSLTLLESVVTPEPLVALAFGLMVCGLLLKTALFPFHFWLPPAHGGAAAPVSALLSALVIKGSFYLVVRLWFGPFAGVAGMVAAQWVGALGGAAVIWGSLQALLQPRLKMLVAYSTVAQVGYLFLLFPLATAVSAVTAETALAGGVMQALSHALAKASMFTAAGAIIVATGSDEITRLGGIGRRLPVTMLAFSMAALSLMGLPPSGGFSAKWLLLSAALGAGQWWWAVVIVVGGLLSAAYLFLVVRQSLRIKRGSRVESERARGLEWAAFMLAAAGLLLGLFGSLPLKLLTIGGGA